MRSRTVEQLATASGPELARLIEQAIAGLETLSDAQRLEVVLASARLDAWSAAMRARAILAVYDSARADITATSAELAQAQARAQAASAQRRTAAGLPAQRTVAGRSHEFDDERLLHRRVGTEVALALGVSSWTADREVDLALDLAAHPPMMRALADGVVDRAQAQVILDGIATVQAPATRRQLVASFLGPDDSPDGDDFDPEEIAGDVDDCGNPVPLVRELTRPGTTLWSLPPGRLKPILRREVVSADPDGALEAVRRARSQRRVEFDDQPDCMTELHLRTTTPAAAAAYSNLDQTARAIRQAGDQRTLDQLRADIAIGWLTEGAYGTYVTRPARRSSADVTRPARQSGADVTCSPEPRGAVLHLTAADTTMLGLDDEPGILHGPRGPIPIPADLAREIGADERTRWRTLRYDPRTGIATDLSNSYRPPPLMRAFVQARDGQLTRMPISCATRLELDHIRAYDHGNPGAGGQTIAANLVSAGRRDHHLKTDGVVQVCGNANETLTITTPSGRTYPSHPYLYARPINPAGSSGDPPF